MRSRRDRAGGRVLLAPRALGEIAAGFDHLAAVLAITLGPARGPILNARSGGSVELLSDAGTIARRVVALPDRGRNTGAMILRHLAWRMHEQFGDGAATAAVLSRAMVREAVKHIAAGVDPVTIREGLERALPAAMAALESEAAPIAGQKDLAGVAAGITGDPELGAVLGEIVDFLGADAALTIEEFPVPYLDREYLEGAAWRAHPAARSMIPEGRREFVLEHPLIMLVDQRLTAIDDVIPALEIAAQSTGRRPLLIVAAKIDGHALAMVIANQAQGTVAAIASRLGETGPALTDALGDMAALTDGSVLADVLGRPPGQVGLEEMGSARRVALSRDTLTIVGGAGDPAAAAERASLLRRRMTSLTPGAAEWQGLQGRVGRLGGGSAILKIGAHSGSELAHKRSQAEKAFRVLSGMLVDGVVPGGGVAYLACVPAVAAMRDTCPVPAQEQGVDVLLAALAAPFTRIVRNHGLIDPALARETSSRLGCGYGFDAVSGTYVDMRERGILDSLQVVRGALQLATSSAISVLTTGVVVLPSSSRRERRVQP